jgi:hypothetical protein
MMNEQLSLFKEAPPPVPNETEFEARLEAIATDIELLQATAVLRVAERLAEAHGLFLYRRHVGGFTGWVEQRLSMSERTAYNLLDVHKQFGGQSLQQLQRLPRNVLYLIARGSTSPEARAEVIERAGAGEEMTYAKAKAIVAKPKAPKVADLGQAPAASTEPISPAPIVKQDESAARRAPLSLEAKPQRGTMVMTPPRPHPYRPGWDRVDFVWVDAQRSARSRRRSKDDVRGLSKASMRDKSGEQQ